MNAHELFTQYVKQQRPRCPDCGYELGEIRDPRCPECGAEFELALRTCFSRARPVAGVVTGALAIGLGATLFALFFRIRIYLYNPNPVNWDWTLWFCFIVAATLGALLAAWVGVLERRLRRRPAAQTLAVVLALAGTFAQICFLEWMIFA